MHPGSMPWAKGKAQKEGAGTVVVTTIPTNARIRRAAERVPKEAKEAPEARRARATLRGTRATEKAQKVDVGIAEAIIIPPNAHMARGTKDGEVARQARERA